jgi:hypothetical protein
MTKISTNHCTTKNAFSKALIVILALVLLFSSYTIATEIDRAHAEEITTPGFILCKSYVVIRQWASKRATEIGQLDPAEPIEIDGRTKDGYAHIVAPCDGWVHAGYIVFSEPKAVNATATVTARKRVACRKWIDGPNVDSKPWLISGSEVRIYWMCDDWALTNRGYVKSEWLEVCEP